MKKRLLTVGDSFTYGDELEDRYSAWPYRLAEHIRYEVVNLGKSGCSNASIVRRTIAELSEPASGKYDLVVIGWTSAGRIEWKDDIGEAYNLWPGYSPQSPSIGDHPWRYDLLNYINKYHNVEYMFRQYLMNVILMQSYLDAKGIPYVMLNIVNNEYYRKVGLPLVTNLAAEVNKDCFLGWDTFGMAEIAYGCPKGPGGHPLELGHQKIAEKINEHIRNLGWLS